MVFGLVVCCLVLSPLHPSFVFPFPTLPYAAATTLLPYVYIGVLLPFLLFQIELVQKQLKLMNAEDASKRSIALPALQPLAKAAAGRFDTTFLDRDVRISRGRFGELRVFQREA